MRGDTGTELALVALDNPASLAGGELVVNDHIDGDGLLAVSLVCRGQSITDPATRLLLRQAAAMADFSEYYGKAPARLVLQLHRCIAEEEAAAQQTGMAPGVLSDIQPWQQQCYSASHCQLA